MKTEIPARVRVRDAVHYWEPRRAIYNLVLAVVVAAWVATAWPHFGQGVSLVWLARLGVLALLANLCYSAAYIAEVSAQRSAWRSAWQANRWVVWLAGTLLAVLLASYWMVDEVHPSGAQIGARSAWLALGTQALPNKCDQACPAWPTSHAGGWSQGDR